MKYIITGNKAKQSNMSAFNQGRYYEQVNLSLHEGIHIYSRLKNEIENIIRLKINICTLTVLKREFKYCILSYKKEDTLNVILNTLYDELNLKEKGYQLELEKYFNQYIIRLSKCLQRSGGYMSGTKNVWKKEVVLNETDIKVVASAMKMALKEGFYDTPEGVSEPDISACIDKLGLSENLEWSDWSDWEN